MQAGEPTSLSCDGGLREMRSVYLSQMLHRLGNRVVVIVPNFSHQKKVNRFTNRRTVCTDLEGIQYRLLTSLGYVKSHSIRRFLDHLIFGILVFFELFRLKVIEKNNLKVIYVGFPQVEAAFFSVLFSKIAKVKCIVDFKDDWPEMFRYGGYNHNLSFCALYYYYRLQLIFVAKFCHSWTTISEPFEALMLSRSGSLALKKRLVSSLTSKNKSVQRTPKNDALNKQDPKKTPRLIHLLFAGTLSASVYDFLTLKKILTTSSYKFHITLVGGGSDLENVLELMTAENIKVTFESWVDENMLSSIYSANDYFLVPISNRIDFVSSFPNKFIDGLSARLIPFVPSGSAMGHLCRRYNVGVCYHDKLNGHDLDTMIDANFKNRQQKLLSMEEMLREEFEHSKNYLRLANFVQPQ